MELVKQINHAKNLSFSQLCKYNDIVKPYHLQLHDFIQTIYDDLVVYFSTYLRNIATSVNNIIQDSSNLYLYENQIYTIRHDLKLSMLNPIQNKLRDFIRNKSLEFIKIVIFYFMLNIPMIIHLYNEKIDKLFKIIEHQKSLVLDSNK
jgi:hypothetical protein